MIETDLTQRIEIKIHEISEVLLNFDYRNHNNIGYLSGLSGMIPYMLEYGNYYNNNDFISLAESYIYEIISRIEEYKFGNLSFSNGLSGFGYVIEELVEKDYIERNDFLVNFDQYFCDALLSNLKNNNWDALHGAIGITHYLFKRVNHSNTVRKTIEAMVDWLMDNSEPGKMGIKWHTFMNPKKERQYNLGLAHGMPSILFFLSSCINHQIKVEKCHEILNPAIDFFISNKAEGKSFIFPSAEEGSDTGPRLAWCYGDLGITSAVMHLNNTIGGLDELLLELSISLRQRKDLKASKINDAGFCHGAAGALHIFNFLHTNNIEVIEQEDISFWISKTLNFAVGNDMDSYAGYAEFQLKEDQAYYRKAIGLLNGVTGIGHTFLSLINKDLNWSKGLMV